MTKARNPQTDTLTLARGLAVVACGAALAAGALGWGRPGLLAAAAGVALSLINVWALERMAARAVGRVAELGAGAAAAQLTSALGAKTMVLLGAVFVLARLARLEALPFALGLMVSVASLLGAGLVSARRAEAK